LREQVQLRYEYVNKEPSASLVNLKSKKFSDDSYEED